MSSLILPIGQLLFDKLLKLGEFRRGEAFGSTRLITRLSAEPPNIRSTRSPRACPMAWLRPTAGR